MRNGIPQSECRLLPRGQTAPEYSVSISCDSPGQYRVQPQEGLDLRGERYDLAWPSGYVEPVLLWLIGVHQLGDPPPYVLN